MKKIFLFAVCFFAVGFLFAESRNALLIANAAYTNAPLSTPIQEARGLKQSLVKLGFNVTLVENADINAMEKAVGDFGSLIKNRGGIGFFHYGGHAVQIGGKNYLIPAKTDIETEAQIKRLSLDLDYIMESMQAETNIVILDSCRDNPIPSATRGATRGLALSTVKPKNSIIVYSAEAGNKARDGVFTPILTKKILEQKSLHSILLDVRREVSKATGGAQIPKNDDGLFDDIYLAGHAPATAPAPAPVAAVSVPEPVRAPEPASASADLVPPRVKNANYDLQMAISQGDFGPLMEKILQRAQEKAGTNFKNYTGLSKRGWNAGFNAALELKSGYVLGFRDFQSGYNRWKLVCVTAGDGFAKDKDYEAKLKLVSKKYGWKLPSNTSVDEDRQKKFVSNAAFYDWVSDSEKASDELAEFLKCFK